MPLQLERKRDPTLTSPLIADTSQGKVITASQDVLESGVERGMSLYRARQIAPFAQVVEADEFAYFACHEAVFAALSALAGRIEIVALGEFLLQWQGYRDFDASGYSTQVASILTAIRTASELETQIGVATHRFTAEQAARRISDDGIFVVRPGSDARFLAPLPITALPNPPADMLVRLHDFGIHTLGQLASLPKAAFVRQFGSGVAALHDLARGCDPRPLNPGAPPVRVVRERRFDQPVERHSTVIGAVRTLARSISRTLTECGYQAEAIKLSVKFASGGRSETTRALKPPTADAERLAWFVTQLVEAQAFDEPVSQVVVIAYPVRKWHEGAQQLSLFEADREARRIRLEETFQVLKRRLGESIVRVAAQIEPPKPVPAQVQTTNNGIPTAITEHDEMRRIAAIEEFWREESGWWDVPARRDYYRVILDNGSQRNLFFDCVGKAWYVDRSWHVLRAA